MDRERMHWAVRGSPMQTPWCSPLKLLLQTSANKRVRAMVNETSGRALHDPALLRFTKDRSRAEKRGAQRQPQACATDHETAWYCEQSARTKHLKAASRTHQIPLFTERTDFGQPSRGVEHRYHLYSASTGLCLPRSYYRLVQSPCSLFSLVKQPRNEFLPRSFRRGYQLLWLSKNLQHRSRSAVYFTGICPGCTGQENPVQHGWTWSSPGQHFHRAPMEVCEV